MQRRVAWNVAKKIFALSVDFSVRIRSVKGPKIAGWNCVREYGQLAGLACTCIPRAQGAAEQSKVATSSRRYYRRFGGAQKVVNLAELWRSRTWTAPRTSTVWKVRREQGLPAVQERRRGEVVGAVRLL